MGDFYSSKETGEKHLKAIENIYKEVNDLTDNFRSYDGVFGIYNINEEMANKTEPKTFEISKLLYDILEEGLLIGEETNGYFDMTMGHIIDIWKDLIDEYEFFYLPEDKVEEAINQVNQIEIVEEPLNLSKEDGKYFVTVKPGVKIDLGAHAKGYATKLVKEYFKTNEIINYMINGGGSSLSLGAKNSAKDDSFLIGLKNPFYGIYQNEEQYFAFYKNKNVSISTSGNYEQYTEGEDGNWYHHIISPKTKKPENKYYSIIIIGDDAGLLDGYTTALFSMDIEEIEIFLMGKDNLEAIIYDNERNIININKTEHYLPEL